MIRGERRKALIHMAERLAQELQRFQAKEGGDPVNRSQLEEVRRYLQAHPDGDGLQEFLNGLPRSYLSRVSRGAGGQLGEVRRAVGERLKTIKDMAELHYMLGWAARLMPREPRGTGESGGGRREARQ